MLLFFLSQLQEGNENYNGGIDCKNFIHLHFRHLGFVFNICMKITMETFLEFVCTQEIKIFPGKNSPILGAWQWRRTCSGLVFRQIHCVVESSGERRQSQREEIMSDIKEDRQSCCEAICTTKSQMNFVSKLPSSGKSNAATQRSWLPSSSLLRTPTTKARASTVRDPCCLGKNSRVVAGIRRQSPLSQRQPSGKRRNWVTNQF